MKKLIISIGIVCLFNTASKAQIPVTDVASIATDVSQQIINIAEQIEHKIQLVTEVKKTIEIIEQGKEAVAKLKRVTDTIKGYQKVLATLNMGKDILLIYQTNISRMASDKNFTEEEISNMIDGYLILMKETDDLIGDLKIVYQANTIELTDKDRFEIINKVHDRLREHKALVQYYTNKNISVSYLRAKQNNDSQSVINLYRIN